MVGALAIGYAARRGSHPPYLARRGAGHRRLARRVVGARHLRIEREVKHRSVGGGLARSDQRRIHRGDEICAAQHDQPRAMLGAIARE
jgi:hypothetical protein